MDRPHRTPLRYRADSAWADVIWLTQGTLHTICGLGIPAVDCIFRALL